MTNHHNEWPFEVPKFTRLEDITPTEGMWVEIIDSRGTTRRGTVVCLSGYLAVECSASRSTYPLQWSWNDLRTLCIYSESLGYCGSGEALYNKSYNDFKQRKEERLDKITSLQKRKELVLDYFGLFAPGDGSHAEACYHALCDYHEWLEDCGALDGEETYAE